MDDRLMAKIEEARLWHMPYKHAFHSKTVCQCGAREWPCVTRRALDALEESEARAQRLIEAGDNRACSCGKRNGIEPMCGGCAVWEQAKSSRVAEVLEGRDG
jgi:hypothetical protein